MSDLVVFLLSAVAITIAWPVLFAAWLAQECQDFSALGLLGMIGTSVLVELAWLGMLGRCIALAS